MSRVPLSVLDLATVREGHDSGDALRGTTAVAQTADALGFTRFWVAEHHNMPAVASTSPAVLMAHLAARTTRIRVGSGGVMLPNHQPLVVAEQFALLEALHPGRVDLGIGRAPGSDQRTAVALRGRAPHVDVEQFPDHLTAVMGLLGDERVETSALSATPAASSFPQVWLLGSSTYSAQVAAAYGLPFAFAHHFAQSTTAPGAGLDEALELYRAGFRPSPGLDAPHVMVSASVVAAETERQARFRAGPSRMMSLSLRTGRLRPLPSPEQAEAYDASPAERALLATLPGTQHVGTGAQVVDGLDALVARTGADELLLAGVEHDPASRQETLTRVAEAWGLARVDAAA